MKTKLRRPLTRYFNSWWLPAVVCGGLILVSAGFIIGSILAPDYALYLNLAAICTLIGVAIALCSFISSILWIAAKKQWKKFGASLFTAFMLGIEVLVLCVAIFVVNIGSSLGPDHFADNLSIPDNIEIVEPVSRDDPFQNWQGEEIPRYEDPFRQAMLSALDNSDDPDIAVTADVDSLSSLWKNNPDILERYFATSPTWFLTERYGGKVAIRKWLASPDWQDESPGFYEMREGEYFSVDLEIGFLNDFAKKRKGAVRAQAGETVDLPSFGPPDVERDRHDSELVVHDKNDNFIFIIERSAHKDRDLTQATLSFIEEELAPLAASPTEDTIRTMLPENGIRNGEPSIQLRTRYQPGMYQAASWVNPGEAGTVYLKAFEVTGNVPLSQKQLKFETEERIGWSDDPSELFLANSKFKIYEGDWGKPYAARFEVWFTSDSGKGDDRKLTEQNFQIEGWMH